MQQLCSSCATDKHSLDTLMLFEQDWFCVDCPLTKVNDVTTNKIKKATSITQTKGFLTSSNAKLKVNIKAKQGMYEMLTRKVLK